MTRMLASVGVVVLLPSIVIGQPGAARPSFDAADVHVSPRADSSRNGLAQMQGGFLIADRYELRKATMLDLIRTAYNVDADKVIGGPSWLDCDRFDIVAKTKPGTRLETLRLMLQTLLANRFNLAVKTETRQVPNYVLSRGARELRLKVASGASNSTGCQRLAQVIDGGAPRSIILQCRNVTMDAFAQTLSPLVSGRLRSLLVVNSTGLKGGWDFDFRYAPRQEWADSAADAGVFEGIDNLGLKLELGKVPQEVLAVEGVNQRPSSNPADVAVALPPQPPPEFEVASVRPCTEKITVTLYVHFEPGGRVSATCEPLHLLVREAWSLPLREELVGAPKWLTEVPSSHNVSIEAKTPASLAIDQQQDMDEAGDLLRAMLRSLLMDRYKMKVHYEERFRDAATLVAVKPKLAKANPANRTGCSSVGRRSQGGPVTVRLVCQNMTMPQFAERINSYDPSTVYPVQDATGIDGAWDFAINFNERAGLSSRLPQPGGAVAAAGGEASEPATALSFAQAIEKQLGLKLKTQKRREPALVIDHIEEKPTDN